MKSPTVYTHVRRGVSFSVWTSPFLEKNITQRGGGICISNLIYTYECLYFNCLFRPSLDPTRRNRIFSSMVTSKSWWDIIYPSINPAIYVHLSIYPSIQLFMIIYLSIHQSSYLWSSIYLSINPAIYDHLSIHPSSYLWSSIYLSINLFSIIYYLSTLILSRQVITKISQCHDILW